MGHSHHGGRSPGAIEPIHLAGTRPGRPADLVGPQTRRAGRTGP